MVFDMNAEIIDTTGGGLKTNSAGLLYDSLFSCLTNLEGRLDNTDFKGPKEAKSEAKEILTFVGMYIKNHELPDEDNLSKVYKLVRDKINAYGSEDYIKLKASAMTGE